MNWKTRKLGRRGRAEQFRRARVRYAIHVLPYINHDTLVWLLRTDCEGFRFPFSAPRLDIAIDRMANRARECAEKIDRSLLALKKRMAELGEES